MALFAGVFKKPDLLTLRPKICSCSMVKCWGGFGVWQGENRATGSVHVRATDLFSLAVCGEKKEKEKRFPVLRKVRDVPN